jgi:predicted flap endonuclease-1-like 5' DNA nuclease
MASIIDIEGIGEKFAEKLRAAGIRTTEALLQKAATPKGRKELAAQTGIDESKLLEWANRADLYRIRGIGSEYSDLLEAAGVDTVPELAQRDPKNLYEKLVSVNQAKNLVNKLPGPEQVADWIKQAKALPRVIEH